MLHEYQQAANEILIRRLAGQSQWAAAFEELARPLHEALYKEQSFDFLDSLPPMERLILSLDYVQMQIGQGGFIQLIQNKYTPLLLTVIESAEALGIEPELRETLDDALKVYVLNNEQLGRETTPQEFAGLYEEFKEFEVLDQKFHEQLPTVMQLIVSQVLGL